MHFVLHPVNRAWGSICADKVKGAVMKEVINLIFSTWQSYWNGSGYPYLLVGTVLFILAGLFLRGQYGRKKYIKFGQNPEKDDRVRSGRKMRTDRVQKRKQARLPSTHFWLWQLSSFR